MITQPPFNLHPASHHNQPFLLQPMLNKQAFQTNKPFASYCKNATTKQDQSLITPIPGKDISTIFGAIFERMQNNVVK
jgi:hypothetical protein